MKEFKNRLKERYQERKQGKQNRWSSWIIKLIVFLLILSFIKDFAEKNDIGLFDFFLNDSQEIQNTIE
jgi:hypothetical protein